MQTITIPRMEIITLSNIDSAQFIGVDSAPKNKWGMSSISSNQMINIMNKIPIVSHMITRFKTKYFLGISIFSTFSFY